MLEAGAGRGLKTGRFFFCLRADGPIMLRGELNNRKFMVIKFSFKIFKILSRFESDSFWNSEMACSHRHLIANPSLCVDSAINRSLFAQLFMSLVFL